MAGLKNNTFTMTASGLSRSEALTLKSEMINITKQTAPHAKSSIAIGHKSHMEQIIDRCKRGLLSQPCQWQVDLMSKGVEKS